MSAWANAHAIDCPVAVARATFDAQPWPSAAVREGARIELDAGGDDEAENCTCRVERTCRDCQSPYTVPASKADAGTKWWSLCGGCLAWEL